MEFVYVAGMVEIFTNFQLKEIYILQICIYYFSKLCILGAQRIRVTCIYKVVTSHFLHTLFDDVEVSLYGIE